MRPRGPIDWIIAYVRSCRWPVVGGGGRAAAVIDQLLGRYLLGLLLAAGLAVAGWQLVCMGVGAPRIAGDAGRVSGIVSDNTVED